MTMSAIMIISTRSENEVSVINVACSATYTSTDVATVIWIYVVRVFIDFKTAVEKSQYWVFGDVTKSNMRLITFESHGLHGL